MQRGFPLSLSAAFDTVDQDVLLNRLSTGFGVQGLCFTLVCV